MVQSNAPARTDAYTPLHTHRQHHLCSSLCLVSNTRQRPLP
jgi:hypothetical protein